MTPTRILIIDRARRIARAVVAGPGIRVAALCGLFAVIVSMAAYCLTRGTPDPSRANIGSLFGYVLVYWRVHWVTGFFLGLTAVVLGFTSLLERLVAVKVAPIEIEVTDYQRDRLLAIAARLLAIAVLIAAFIVLPYVNVLVHAYVRRVFYGLYLLSGALTYYFALARPHCGAIKRRLATFTFIKRPAFNIATIGARALEAQLAKQLYDGKIADRVTPDSSAMISRGAPDPRTRWRGNDIFLQRLGEFVGIPPASITLHEKTTTAVAAALEYLDAAKAFCIFTDLEFPSIRDLIRTRFRGRHEQIGCADALWDGLIDGDDVADRVLEAVARDRKRVARIIICVSHIAYESGLWINIQRLLAGLPASRDIRVIIDGAQAVGNIEVPEDIFERVDFYAFSGHKWLLGDPTLGILYGNYERAGVAPQDLASALVKSRPFSYYEQPEGENETINLDAYITLNAMLSDFTLSGAKNIDAHNTEIARKFRRWIDHMAIAHMPRMKQRGGIVPVMVSDAATVARRLYERTGFATQPVRKNTALRICFHYNVGERDAHRLAYEMGRVLYPLVAAADRSLPADDPAIMVTSD